MATTTPNFGWSVPTSSDLVKNGATAIETLGDSIDASLVDLKGGTTGQVLSKASGTDMDFSWATPAVSSSGLTQIGSKVTFTAAAGVNVNSCFSATYNRYLVLLRIKAASGGVRCYVKLRASGTDASTNYYYSFLESLYSGAAPTNTAANAATTGFPTIIPTTGYTNSGGFTFFSPFETVETTVTQQSLSIDTGGLAIQGAGVLLNTTSYDGFSLVFASGTYTGELVVYGYSN